VHIRWFFEHLSLVLKVTTKGIMIYSVLFSERKEVFFWNYIYGKFEEAKKSYYFSSGIVL